MYHTEPSLAEIRAVTKKGLVQKNQQYSSCYLVAPPSGAGIAKDETKKQLMEDQPPNDMYEVLFDMLIPSGMKYWSSIFYSCIFAVYTHWVYPDHTVLHINSNVGFSLASAATRGNKWIGLENSSAMAKNMPRFIISYFASRSQKEVKDIQYFGNFLKGKLELHFDCTITNFL